MPLVTCHQWQTKRWSETWKRRDARWEPELENGNMIILKFATCHVFIVSTAARGGKEKRGIFHIGPLIRLYSCFPHCLRFDLDLNRSTKICVQFRVCLINNSSRSKIKYISHVNRKRSGGNSRRLFYTQTYPSYLKDAHSTEKECWWSWWRRKVICIILPKLDSSRAE